MGGAEVGVVSIDEDPQTYGKISATGPITKLQERVTSGQVQLPYADGHGFLRGVLKAFEIPESSQILVFSKTSLQRPDIGPKKPRALYFNDEVYVAWVPGAELLELATFDPVLGAVWYTLDQKQQTQPSFKRNDRCLECHVTSKTRGVPGHLARSNVPDADGSVGLLESSAVTDHTWPLSKRWGGWYVTGAHGEQLHRGNVFGESARKDLKRGLNARANMTRLSELVDLSGYPGPGSDIVSLMVFDHQIKMHNLLTLLKYEANLHIARYGHVKYLKSMSRELLRYMLFVDETKLTHPVRGTSGFTKEFQSKGLKDGKGRSLRDFNLKTRMFEFPCSYLIHSEAFDSLPKPILKHLYHQLWNVLAGEDSGTEFDGIPQETRQAIKEILIETKPDLPVYWTL